MAYSLYPVQGIDMTQTSTSQVFPLGLEVSANDGAQYVYVKASAAVAQYAACKMDDTQFIAELTTTISGSEPTRVVVPQVAFATDEFGWAIFKGPLTVKVLASCVQDVKLYTTATAGAVDDTATDLIQGLKILTTVGGAPTSTAGFAAIPMCTNCQD